MKSYRQYRAEGVGEKAIQTLMVSHDLLRLDDATPERVANFLRMSQRQFPLAVEDVWPEGAPNHWQGEVLS